MATSIRYVVGVHYILHTSIAQQSVCVLVSTTREQLAAKPAFMHNLHHIHTNTRILVVSRIYVGI